MYTDCQPACAVLVFEPTRQASSPEKPLPEEKVLALALACAWQELMNLPFQSLLLAAAFATAWASEKAAPPLPKEKAVASADASATQSLRLGRWPLPFLKLSTKAVAVASAEATEPAGTESEAAPSEGMVASVFGLDFMCNCWFALQQSWVAARQRVFGLTALSTGEELAVLQWHIRLCSEC